MELPEVTVMSPDAFIAGVNVGLFVTRWVR